MERVSGNGRRHALRHRLHCREHARNRIDRYILFAVAGIANFIQRALGAYHMYGKAGIAHADFHVFIAVDRYLSPGGRRINRKRIRAHHRAGRGGAHLDFGRNGLGNIADYAVRYRICVQFRSNIQTGVQQLCVVFQIGTGIIALIILNAECALRFRADCFRRRFNLRRRLKLENLQRNRRRQAAFRMQGKRGFPGSRLRRDRSIRVHHRDVGIRYFKGNRAGFFAFRIMDQAVCVQLRIQLIRRSARNAAHFNDVDIERNGFLRIAHIYAAGRRNAGILPGSGGNRYIIHTIAGILMRGQRAVRAHGNVFRMIGFIGKIAQRVFRANRRVRERIARLHTQRAVGKAYLSLLRRGQQCKRIRPLLHAFKRSLTSDGGGRGFGNISNYAIFNRIYPEIRFHIHFHIQQIFIIDQGIGLIIPFIIIDVEAALHAHGTGAGRRFNLRPIHQFQNLQRHRS